MFKGFVITFTVYLYFIYGLFKVKVHLRFIEGLFRIDLGFI